MFHTHTEHKSRKLCDICIINVTIYLHMEKHDAFHFCHIPNGKSQLQVIQKYTLLHLNV